MSIWHTPPDLESLNQFAKETLSETLGIHLTEVGDDFLQATMAVDHRTVQPLRLLHGGASVALAETLGSIAATLCVDGATKSCVGLEINANHVRAAREGTVVTGTVTPLHHDNCNIFFCQIVGRKQFRLIPPVSDRLLASANGFYADPALVREPDLGGLEVTLEPGMCLFLPMGWWHEVRSLETSISISLLRFREPSTADWYAPGNIRR